MNEKNKNLDPQEMNQKDGNLETCLSPKGAPIDVDKLAR